MVRTPLDRLRGIALALPETSERISHGMPTFFAGKKTFCNWVDDHHGDGRTGMWCNAPQGAQRQLVDGDPERFFVPPYVGPRGWIGMRLDGGPDWDVVADIVEDAYRMVALQRMLRQLDA